MNIGFDIDDTLNNPLYENFNTKFVDAYFKEIGKSFNLINPKETFFGKMYDWSKDEVDAFWSMRGEDYLKNVPVRKGAKEILSELKKSGHKIYIITQRYITNPYNLSFEWLTKNGLVFDELIVNAKDKIEICKDKKIDIMIDDRVSYCDGLIANGVKACVMNTPANQSEQTTALRVNSFKEFYDIIKRLEKTTNNNDLGKVLI